MNAKEGESEAAADLSPVANSLEENDNNNNSTNNKCSKRSVTRRMSNVVELLEDRSYGGHYLTLPTSRARWASPYSGHGGSCGSSSLATGARCQPSLLSSVAWNRRRMQNMILVVGPGTPASLLSGDVGYSSSDDDDDDDDDDDSEHGQEGGNDEEEAEDSQLESMNAEEREEDGRDDSVSSDSEEGDGSLGPAAAAAAAASADSDPATGPPRRGERASSSSAGGARTVPFRLRHFLRELYPGRWAEENEGEGNPLRSRPGSSLHPSMRHGGCINTACWLDAPWRLSRREAATSSPCAVDNREGPTQVLTSGDDRTVKVFDVSGAMGMDPVTPGGWNTYLPFGRNNRLRPSNAGVDPDWKQQWKNEVTAPSRRYCRRPCGTVELLASLATGHRGNVFHVTPFPTEPGSVLTCGADGCLRLGNLATGTASVVLHPNEARDGEDVDMPSPFMLRMAFSHVMVSPHTGLLCSERGLHRFDLRLSPRDQPRKSLLAAAYLSSGAGAGASASNGSSARRRFHSCKACAVWNPHALDRDAGGKFLPVEMESYYVFAGGASPTVGLFDVRMDASTHPRVVELYKPLGIQGSGTDVSVSGLDVSKNARELLVSYESDQIYAFPIAHTVNRNPTSYDIDRLCDVYSDPKHPPNEEMASYGGHLNRFTFLKNARYAGPDDEYIVTGSDSGHAWIFQRDTGTVVSLLGADSATCNGVVPHPNLPFFITYGIDSTAKLWRATPPVDPLADDSPAARADRATHATYEMSPVTKSWDNVQVLLNRVDGEPALFPDYIASPAEVQAAGRFSTGGRRRICASNDDAPHFGNALEILPSILRQNRYECYKSLHLELETIVSHKLDLFSHRVSISKMQHQADRLGLGFEPWAPWALRPVSSNPRVHPADLVPDWPSDWIVYVPNIMFDRYSVDPRTSFVHTRYEPDVFATYFPRFFDSRASYFEAGVPWLPHLKLWEDRHQSAVTIIKPNGLPREDRNESGSDQDDQPVPASSACEALLAESAAARPFSAGDGDTRRHLLFETARLLKEGGNEAMKAGLLDAAARRYDKAMQYCALAFMRYFRGQTLGCLTRGHHEWTNEEGVQLTSELIVVWSPLLHVLITSRLNLALILLRPSFLQPQLAAGQARAALRLLEPFSIELGKVIERHEGKADVILSSNEPASTYVEAKALQAKAYYRLGSAELEAGDYASAVKMFDASLRSSSGSGQGKDVKPDALTVKRLQEAKRRHMASKKRERAKYEKALFPS